MASRWINGAMVVGLLAALGAANVGCAADAQEEPVSASEAELNARAWKMVTLIFRTTDVYAGGKHVRTSMSLTGRLGAAHQAALGVPSLFAKYSGYRGRATMDVIEVDETLHKVSRDAMGGFWVSPGDVKAELDRYAPKGRYDSIFIMWEPGTGQNAVDVRAAWGMGPSTGGSDTNGATYAAVHPDTSSEGLVHEWLHGAGAFYRGLGFDVPDPHENRTFGFAHDDKNGSWGAWYTSLLSGEMRRDGERCGYRERVWASGTPTKKLTPGAVTNVMHSPARPNLREARTWGSDWVYLRWSTAPGVGKYTYFVTVKRPDGRMAESAVAYGTGGMDRGDDNYAYVHRNAICAAAKRSGLSGSLALHAQVWSDDQADYRDDQDVAGRISCP
jgi:hypothetical protein